MVHTQYSQDEDLNFHRRDRRDPAGISELQTYVGQLRQLLVVTLPASNSVLKTTTPTTLALAVV